MGASQFGGEDFGGQDGATSVNRTGRMSGAEFLRAFVRALREWPGWFTGAVGVVLCVLGWYGVSGESVTARQLPYLASATAPGAALIVAGAVLVAARPSGGRGGPRELTDRRIEALYALLVEQPDGTEPAEQPAPEDDGAPRALPDGTLYHRRGCLLVTGKERAEPVDEAGARRRGLAPCPVCDPGPPPPAPAATG